MPRRVLRASASGPEAPHSQHDREAALSVAPSGAGGGTRVPADVGDTEVGEVLGSPAPPVQRLEDIYTFAYTAGFRLALPEDPMVEALVDVRRHLGSYLSETERDAFERLGDSTGQWWAAFRRGWKDRRTGKKPDPHYRGKAPRR